MPTDLMPSETRVPAEPTRPNAARKTAEDAERSVREIIEAARSAPREARGRAALLVSLLSAVTLWASFTPLDWAPLAWVALVPLMLLVRIEQPTSRMYRAVYAGGLVLNLLALQWMRLGHWTMYGAWVALALYLALAFPLFVGLSRVAVHRLRIPLVLATPMVWVGLEYLRAHVMTGFSWYYLGHTQYRWVEMIQISDLVGAYGVSFVVAMTSAALAGLLPQRVLARLGLLPGTVVVELGWRISRQQWAGLAASLVVFSGVLAYGFIRRDQAEFQPGPRVALIQGNFTASVKHDPAQESVILKTHDALTGMAVRHQPDLIVWPETMLRSGYLAASPDLSAEELEKLAPRIPPQAWKDPFTRDYLGRLSGKAGAALVVGVDAGVADTEGFRHYNSALLVRPQSGITARYDKQHRVVFGEYIPLKEQIPWMAKLVPFSEDFGIAPGEESVVFEHQGYRFAPIICFEDTVPHLVRGMLHEADQQTSAGNSRESGKSVDCLVNLTNDGWFHGSSELDQHLITAAFRAVECRTPMVRAVNTGVSAVIDGDGMIIEPDVFIDADARMRGSEGPRRSMRDRQSGRWHKQLNAVLVDTIPLDNRRSLYVAYGDWFGGACGFSCMFLLACGWVTRRRDAKSVHYPLEDDAADAPGREGGDA